MGYVSVMFMSAPLVCDRGGNTLTHVWWNRTKRLDLICVRYEGPIDFFYQSFVDLRPAPPPMLQPAQHAVNSKLVQLKSLWPLEPNPVLERSKQQHVHHHTPKINESLVVVV